MWDHESQRIGMQKCWPLAYLIHGYGELLGFLGLLGLLGVFGYAIYVGIFHGLGAITWWFLAVPFGAGIISEIMVQSSWIMVGKRGFKYDYETRTASWDENGEHITYKYAQQGNARDRASRGP
jgi:hypothetical protein